MRRHARRTSYAVPRRLREAHIAYPPYFCRECGLDFARGLDDNPDLPRPILKYDDDTCVAWICSACGFTN